MIDQKSNEKESTNEKNDEKLGRQSIFFDPEWNPLGLAPSSFPHKNIKYDPKLHKHHQLTNVLDIPLPDMPQPKYYKLRDYSAVIQSEEVLRDASPSPPKVPFIPRGVQTKKRKIDHVWKASCY